MFSLALECSTSRGSVALSRDLPGDAGPQRWEFAAGRGQGGQLFRALEAALGAVRAAGQPVAEIVVGLGPGSYSGVRQAVAAATGLAVATGAQLSGVPSVLGLSHLDGRCQVVSDARRGTFYYTAVEAGVCVLGPELLPDADALAIRLAEHPGWPVQVVETPLPGGLLPVATVTLPDAVGLLGTPRVVRWPPPLEPIYLRPVSVTLPNPARSVAP